MVICIILIVLAVKIFGGKNEGSSDSDAGPIITTEETDATEVEKVSMPNVTGMKVEDAKSTLTSLGILTEVTYEERKVLLSIQMSAWEHRSIRAAR